ncbi:superfamily II DNA/RNA helicase [Mucilaginibacter yixingensis]|uniref:Superfamily II DNA/RNA helicase n=1 Tax=Mucilaginibacter yixingensis TaxID=1295612 RepID=A0A2T5J5B0_9SPHI|nr:superfamily II DNA/RNA helicase [Mucilaginibacter yixingensis]
MTFEDFNFDSSLAEGLQAMGYVTPTPIQAEAIPVVMQGHDLIACAQTGTGKTASYLLPVLHSIAGTNKHHTDTLILAPTRELAQQIDQQVEGLAYFTGISSIAVFGGGDGIVYEQQRSAIKAGVNILIATPGRLIAHLTSGLLKLDKVRHLVLDEADRMLDMGFYDDIIRIIRHLPAKRQTLLFSATMPPRIRQLAATILHEPQQINIAISKPAEGISQQLYRVFDGQKTPLILKILEDGNYLSTIIFCSTKEKVKMLYKELKSAHIKVAAFHSDFKQSEREEVLLQFKNKKLPVIVGTDALSRGIDVEGIDLVINYDAPPDPEDYVHRIGRTARAATTGTAITLINHKDAHKLKRIETLIGKTIQENPLPEELGEAPKPKTGEHDDRRKNNRNNNNNKKRKPSGQRREGGDARPKDGQAKPEGEAQPQTEGQPQNANGEQQPAKKKNNKKKRWPRRNPKNNDGAQPDAGTQAASSSPVSE